MDNKEDNWIKAYLKHLIITIIVTFVAIFGICTYFGFDYHAILVNWQYILLLAIAILIANFFIKFAWRIIIVVILFGILFYLLRQMNVL